MGVGGLATALVAADVGGVEEPLVLVFLLDVENVQEEEEEDLLNFRFAGCFLIAFLKGQSSSESELPVSDSVSNIAGCQGWGRFLIGLGTKFVRRSGLALLLN